jgi:phage tail tape measure protein, TP901 family, core region
MAQLFGSTEALNTVMVLAGKGSAGFAEALKQMNGASGSTQAAYEKMLTPTEKMDISINRVKNSLIKFGTALTPVFNKVADVIGVVGDKLSNLSEGQVKSIIKFASIAAAVGPAIFAFGKMVTIVSLCVSKFGIITKTIANFGGIMGVITSPAAIVIGVLAAIVIAGVLIYKNWDKIKEAAKKVGAVIKSVFLKSGIDVTKFKNTFSNMKETIGVIVSNLRLIIGKIIVFMKPIVTFLVNVFVAKIKVAFSAAVGFVSGFASGIMQYINGVLKMFKGITEFIAGVFTGDWKRAFNGIKTFFEGWGTAIVGLIKTPINAIIGLINGAIKGVNELGIKIPDWIPVIGGKGFSINIPPIPMLYKGTDNWRGGAAVINDRKGEIVDLPRGSRVYPHDKSVQMARKEGAASGGRSISITINKLADKLEVRNDSDIDKIADALVKKLQKVSLNMGVA